MKRKEVLDAAVECVCGQREQDYGTPENNFACIAGLWNTYLNYAYGGHLAITPKDVALMMALLKVARLTKGCSPDSFIDLAGYAACAGELAEAGIVTTGSYYGIGEVKRNDAKQSN